MLSESQIEGVWTRTVEGDDSATNTSEPIGVIWGARVGLDYILNHLISVGGDLGISRLQGPPVTVQRFGVSQRYESGSRITMNPTLKVRLDFPLDCRWVIESELAFGAMYWGATRGGDAEAYDESRWGTTTRFSLGLRYIINTRVHLLVGVGYAEQEMTLDDGSITISALPIALGLRGGF